MFDGYHLQCVDVICLAAGQFLYCDCILEPYVIGLLQLLHSTPHRRQNEGWKGGRGEEQCRRGASECARERERERCLWVMAVSRQKENVCVRVCSVCESEQRASRGACVGSTRCERKKESGVHENGLQVFMALLGSGFWVLVLRAYNMVVWQG